ncbi:hypothetical protein DYBT9275_05700 [Dyadobacter sp. CECT 9275]|uniref:Uncharacterized protein n=1 Tax=Dyadobacter helix TaxID=2822344 RepID=A0A916JIT3_9BACT|nr:hypothetical protein DYBT9275_05700 [Dyadobacter sp. CECT 9275]
MHFILINKRQAQYQNNRAGSEILPALLFTLSYETKAIVYIVAFS